MPREYKYEGDVLYLKCTQCGKWLTLDGYHKDNSKEFGVRTNCKECKHRTSQRYYQNNQSREKDRVSKRQQSNKTKVDGYKRKYVEFNKLRVSECQKNNRDRHTKELGFNRDTFHQRAIQYVRKHRLRPKCCPICGSNKNIVIHHPSYDGYEKWSYIIFCCQNCHKKIHSGLIACPSPINLLGNCNDPRGGQK